MASHFNIGAYEVSQDGIFEKLTKLWDLLLWPCTCLDNNSNKRRRSEDATGETRTPENLCKLCFGIHKKNNSTKIEDSEEIINICPEKREKVVEVVDKLLGLNAVFQNASNDEKHLNFDSSETKEFLGDVVKRLVAGDHMDNLLQQDTASQKDFIGQTLDEIFEDESSELHLSDEQIRTVFTNDAFGYKVALTDAQNPKLSVIVQFDGKPIGKLCLHGSQVKLQSPTKAYMARNTSSSIVPIPITSEIRKTIRMFPFENFDNDMQNFGTISISGKIFKMYQLCIDQSDPVSIQTYKEDTVQCLLQRLDLIYSTTNRKVIGLYADHRQLKRESNIWTTVGKYDKLTLSFGETSDYDEESISVYLQALDGTQIYVEVMDAETSDSFMNRMTILLDTKSDETLNFVYRCKRIDTGKKMSDYKIKPDDILNFFWPSLGGQGKLCLSIDLSDVSVTTGLGKYAEFGYTYGLNVIGNCRNRDCPSAGGFVYYHLGYPEMEIMDAEKNEYSCPRCFEQEININTFLMAAGRAKFCFRKISTEKDEVKFLESPSTDHSHFAAFNVNNGPSPGVSGLEYDFVRIYTVKHDLSFNKCQGCERSIHLNEEEIAQCGRAFHTSCFNKTKENRCPTCILPEITLDELQSKATSSTDPSITGKVPNKPYGECSITFTNKQDIEKRSIEDFLRCMNRNENSTKHFKNLIDMQQEFVKQNLSQLIKITRIGTDLIAELVSRDVLSDDDEMNLKSIAQDNMKATEAYKIVSQKINGLVVMYEACENSKQSGAAALLKNFIIKLKSDFKSLISRRK